MAGTSETLSVVAAYTAIVLASMYYSGQVSEKTLYNRFVVSVEGLTFPSSNVQRSSEFYANVLDFKKLPGGDSVEKNDALFELPSGEKLLARETKSALSPSEVAFRVRNGFEKLHKELTNRTKKLTTGARVSTIVKRPWGEEFVANDPDGNRFVFYREYRLSRDRR